MMVKQGLLNEASMVPQAYIRYEKYARNERNKAPLGNQTCHSPGVI